MFKKSLVILLYTIVVAVISAVITTTYISNNFVLGSKAENIEPHQDLIQVSQSKVDESPIKEANTIIEFFSYGCHYCALNEPHINDLSARMPQGTKIVYLHLNRSSSGLSRYSGIFATLSVMGIEKQYRDKAYDAVIKDKLDISDATTRELWLKKIGIDVDAYNKASESQEAKDLLKYMADVSAYYDIKATPSFIVNKKWVALQDRKYPAFADQLLSLLQHDKSLEK
ncbi:DsbA family protein [Enterobacillus tribolii]|uniref:Thiol:disulfide interchange protein DsbA n=1 Tax=Enterobacillus tribolii TaxID=1487935 RepID=A0A370QQL5_9GAMM|nr:DsbA family protein [Enterobacillus tribolii]RDK91076.1 thiol:disulfide interchange protein DsbA [Enterobacillus tribolii]